MNDRQYELVDMAEDAAKVGYSIGAFALTTFYKACNIEALKQGMDAYMVSRFEQRLEYFTHEHNNLTDKEKKDFYDNLSSNKQNLNYLYEFVEKARTTTYELHAKLLARLSVELVKNGKLDYYQSTFLANINLLNEVDILKIHNELMKVNFNKTDTKTFKVSNFEDYCTFTKCVQLGFFEHRGPSNSKVYVGGKSVVMNENPVSNKHFNSNDFTEKLYKMLDEIISSE